MRRRAGRGAAIVFESPLSVAGLSALTLAGTLFGAVPHAAPAILGPVLFSVTMLADVAACGALAFLWPAVQSPRAIVVLALSFAAGAVVTLVTLFAVPLLPQIGAAIRHAPPGIWLYTLYHAVVACGALLYLLYRARGNASSAFARQAAIVAVATVAVAVGVLFAFADRLPNLADGASLTGFRSDGVGIALIVAFVAAAVLSSRLAEPTPLERALTLAQVALALDVLVTLLNGGRYSLSFYCSRVLQLTGSAFVLAAALRMLAAAKTSAELDLRRTERESEQRAERIRALWQIGAAQEAIDDPEPRFVRMLESAAQAIRPGTPFVATLSHLDRGSIVYDAVANIHTAGPDPAHAVIRTGASLPLATTVQSLLYADGITQAWNDVAHGALAGTLIATYLGTRAMIGSPLQIGRRTHFIVFSSSESMNAMPFEQSDIAYIDVVAALFSNTFNQIEHVGRLRFQMEHDALTGLKNRVEFRKAVRAQIDGCRPFSIAIVNLNDFRQVNALHGQMIADEVLVEVGVALDRIAPGDLVARMSGDEFGILIREEDDALPIGDALAPYLAPFHEPFHTGDRDGKRMLSIDASLGAARFPADGGTPEELIHAAGVALQVAKDQGARAPVVYEPAMEHRIERRRTASSEIAAAIENDQLRLVYQPTFELASRVIVGAEALVRWDHPERGEILPIDFIPAAEKYGLIGDISRWVFRRVVRDLQANVMPAGFRCYFNLSTQDIEDGSFVATLTEVLHEQPHLGEMIGVEITESGIMKNVERSGTTLDLIRRLGVRVAIDDFGTGYSSLSYLKQLSVDMIKIDRSFVSGLPANETDAALTEVMIGIASRLKLLTLAEGIETDEQCAWLCAHGCRYGQGYLIARPLALIDLMTRFPLSAGI